MLFVFLGKSLIVDNFFVNLKDRKNKDDGNLKSLKCYELYERRPRPPGPSYSYWQTIIKHIAFSGGLGVSIFRFRYSGGVGVSIFR